MFKTLVTIALLSAFGTAIQAATTVYDCGVVPPDSQSIVPAWIKITHDTTTGKVQVFDPVVNTEVGHPIDARIAVDNATRITFAWDLAAVTNIKRQRATEMKYRMTYMKATGKMVLSVTPVGYANVFDGRGSCKLQ